MRTKEETLELCTKAWFEISLIVFIKNIDSGRVRKNFSEEQIKEKIEKYKEELSEMENILDADNYMEFSGENDNYKIEEMDSYGGEGQGEEYWYVFKLTIKETQEEIYVKFDGFYNSWEGGEINDVFFVEPKEVTVTQYFKKVWN